MFKNNKEKKHVILIVSLIFFIPLFQVQAETDYLGEFTAETTIRSNILLDLPELNPGEKAVYLSLKNNYFYNNNKEKISTNRLLIQSRKDLVPLNSEGIKTSVQNLIFQGKTVLPLQLILQPGDKPGIYQNTLLIKTSKREEIIEKKISFKVNSWGKIEILQGEKIEIKNLKDFSKRIYSDGDHAFKVSSNSNWRLYVLLDSDIKGELLKIRVLSNTLDYIYNNTEERIPIREKSDTLIAEGQTTVNDKEKCCILPFILSIEDYTQLEAGKIDFPLRFNLELLS